MDNEQLRGENCSLLERIQQHDELAIGLLYDRYATLAYSVALRVLHDRRRAEGVLLEVFCQIWRDPGRLLPFAASLPFSISMIARNRAIAILLDKPASADDFSPPVWLANCPQPMEAHEQACAAIGLLPPERRARLERAFFDGVMQRRATGPTSPRNPDIHSATSEAVAKLAGSGLEVVDIESDPSFGARRLHLRDSIAHLEGMNRLARVFTQNPTNILQELVTAAVDLCGADSAGISIEQRGGPDDDYYHWVATAGQYSGFLNAKLPRYPSACGVTLERGRAQTFRATQRFFDRMGVKAPTVTDGLLLPWQAEDTRGTIWIMAHGRDEAFDREDRKIMEALANFAATGVGLQHQQELLVDQAKAAAEAAMASSLAQQIGDPVQGLMQTFFLLGEGNGKSGIFTQQAMEDLLKLSDLVSRLQSSPQR